MEGSSTNGATLAKTDVSAMGLYDVTSSLGFPGLGTGNITACFHRPGMIPVARDLAIALCSHLIAIKGQNVFEELSV